MGLRNWLQGLEMISMFLVIISLPCFFIGLWGTKMINELGNHPSKRARIQASGSWKILLMEIFCFMLLIGLYIFLSNLQSM